MSCTTTFLEVCQKVNLLSGMQGVINSVTSAHGMQSNLVEGVRVGWKELQAYRDWSLLQRSATFDTVAGQESYTLQELLGLVHDFGYWPKRGAVIAEEESGQRWDLRFIPWEKYPLRDNSQQVDTPKWYTFDPLSSDLYLERPGKVKTFHLRYYARPQILQNNSDIVNLPDALVDLLVYKGLENFAVYIGNPELFSKYSHEKDKLLGTFMRRQNPGKVIRIKRKFA